MSSKYTRYQKLVDSLKQHSGSECLLWTTRDRFLDPGGKFVVFHRLAFELTYGPILGEIKIFQTCGNLLCYNPLHLSTRTAMSDQSIDMQGMTAYQYLLWTLIGLPEDRTACLLWPFDTRNVGSGKVGVGHAAFDVRRLVYSMFNERDLNASDRVITTCHAPTCYLPSHLSLFYREVDYLLDSVARHSDSDTCLEWPYRRMTTGLPYGIVWEGNRQHFVHRLCYELLHQPLPTDTLVCHSCDNPPCYNPKHLWLGTHADNQRDCVSKGRHAKVCGADHYAAKYSSADVLEMRRLYSAGLKASDIARQFDGDVRHIWSIVNRKIWTHI